MKYSSTVVTGSIAYDVIMDFPGRFIDYLQKDKLHQLNISFVVDKLERQIGGTATNIAYNLSLISKKKITVLGAVGKDGAPLVDFLKKRKISVNGIYQDKKIYTAAGQVITDSNDNQIWGFYYGANEEGKNIDIKTFINKKTLMVISANHPKAFSNFQNQAIKYKVDYLYDPGMVISALPKNDLWKGVKKCQWLVGNDYEISLICKMLNISINQLIERGVKVITTLGEKGVKYQDKNCYHYVSAYKVRKVVDPTGAGDAWRSGFLAGVMDRKSIVNSLKLGNILASFAVEKYGTVNHKPNKKEIICRIKNL